MQSPSTSTTFYQEKLKSLANWVLWLMSLIIVIVAFVPFSPGMPSAGLDPSWIFAMNQAVSQGLAFGKDIVFTFGPYASLYSKTYHPSTDFMMVSGGLYLALSYWACFVFLMKGVHRIWVLAFCVILAVFLFTTDTLFFSAALLVGLVSFKIGSSLEGAVFTKAKLTILYVGFLFAPLGLLPLIKGSMFVLSGVVIAFSTVFFVVLNRRLLAAICIFSPSVSMLVFWIAAGQSVTALPSYLAKLIPIISGYTEAMATEGKIIEVLVYLMTLAFILLAILTQKQLTNSSKIFLLSIYSAFLFVAFKAGFVRHDGHAVISGASILVAALLLPFVIKARVVFPVILCSIATCYYINIHYMDLTAENSVSAFKRNYSSAWQGIENRIQNRNGLKDEFDVTVKSLRELVDFPILQGTTDIYSYNQTNLLASSNSWSPRPTFQSFAAYKPVLAENNKSHLLGKRAPDNIMFKVETIDGRLPSLDDGASWPVLIHNYEPVRMLRDYLQLRKKEIPSTNLETHTMIREQHSFGESVLLPQSSRPVFAQIEIKPTVFGRLANAIYKSSALLITLELKNGGKKQAKIISGMVKSGFLISPLIENTAEFGLLYGKLEYLDSRLVKSMVITSSNEKTWQWKHDYTVTFSQIDIPTPMDISILGVMEGFDDSILGSFAATAEKCDGIIDSINNITPVSLGYSVSNVLNVSGWLAASIDKGTLPDSVYIVFTDKHGIHSYLKTRRTLRPDVGGHFNRPLLNESGFSAFADISAMRKGQYKLGLAKMKSSRIEICPQFNFPITITK
jgi:hypothetical protein